MKMDMPIYWLCLGMNKYSLPTIKYLKLSLQVVAEEISQSNSEVTFKFQGQNLDNKVCSLYPFCCYYYAWVNFVINVFNELFMFVFQDFLSKSDPYLEIAKDRGDGNFITVHRTKVFSNFLCLDYYPHSILRLSFKLSFHKGKLT